jgi:hypothetical protein
MTEGDKVTDKREPVHHEVSFNASLGFSGDLSATKQLDEISAEYARISEASNSRIQKLLSEQQQAASTEIIRAAEAGSAQAGLASGTGAALDATVRAQSSVTGALTVEREQQTQDAIQTLISVVRVGQAENARAAEKLNDLTEKLVVWTGQIRKATNVLVVLGVAGLIVAIIVGIHTFLPAPVIR